MAEYTVTLTVHTKRRLSPGAESELEDVIAKALDEMEHKFPGGEVTDVLNVVVDRT
jgi:hypothetical protein